jgi:putative MATE family efflux protein
VNITTWPRAARRLIALYLDPAFYNRVIELALPIAFQQLVFAVLNLAGSLVVGQLGDVSVAAVGLGNQIYFLLNLMLFGITSGASIFGAQFWGRRDVLNVRRVLGLSLALSAAGGALFTFISLVIPEAALGIYSRDPAVIALGRNYLQISGSSCLFLAVNYGYAAMLRSVGNARVPMVASVVSLAVNLALSYGLVLGRLGLPRLEAVGAAYGLGLSRCVESFILLGWIYWKKLPVAATLRELFSFDRRLSVAVLQRMVPVAFNEIIWSLGVTVYNIIYARLGTDALAAVNIISAIDSLAFVPYLGLGSACAILVGHEIGAGRVDLAYRYASLLLGLSIAIGAVEGFLLVAVGGKVLAFYQVSAMTTDYAQNILVFLALGVGVRAANFVFFIGILRAGGDTRFAMIIDAGSIWVVGVTLTTLGAFVLHLPVPWVYGLTLGDEVAKCIIVTGRFLSRKWIHNLAHSASLGRP